ncbi:MAG TPA: Rieske 2Fe-2S domain-containing protein [Acidimicrobiia bacterium]|jgi:nitrite reductase/ring-hydroxylating ferredoxin subunit
MTQVLLLCTADPKVIRGVEGVAAEAGLAVHAATAGDPPAPPAAVVVDLEGPGAADVLAKLRARFPEALIAGHLGFPDRERWLAAERAGCDVVANRGALATALRNRLAAGPSRGRRHPVMAAADVAGRLGVVHRDPEGPPGVGGAPGKTGPLALYHVGNRIFACADRCPHAGAVLSEGELEAAVVTCPRHGSQFDVRTGERIRGPADADLATFPVLEEGGQIYLLLPHES